MSISWKLRSKTAWIALLSVAMWVAMPLLNAQEGTPAQQTQPPPQTSAPPQSAPLEKKPDASTPQEGANGREQATVTVEKKISPEEARELLNSVDEILQFVSKETGLPIKHSVKRQLATREEVVKYLEDRMKEDKDTERLERAATSLKKFGLLPPDFNLRPYLLELLKEQVAGFYDARTQTVYLLDWVEADAQRPVLAHELTHALQDQSFGMEKWAEIKKNPKGDTESAEIDEERSARQAVLEGQAMVVLIDYTLEPLGKTVMDSPDLVNAMKAGMSSDGASPIYARSPLFLREALVFPYTWGLDFVRQVMKSRGRDGAFAGTLKNPPVDTRQLMEPSTYLAAEKLGQLPIPDFKGILGKDLEVDDTGGIGEFDLYVMLKQWIGTKAADDRARTWRGGYYLTARDKKNKNAPVSLIYTSKWPDANDALEFSRLYVQGLQKRYKSVRPGEHDGTGSMWMTDDGPVELEIRGDTMVVTEGFEREKAKALRELAFGKAKTD